jgi:hypothetical protein
MILNQCKCKYIIKRIYLEMKTEIINSYKFLTSTANDPIFAKIGVPYHISSTAEICCASLLYWVILGTSLILEAKYSK